MLKTKFLPLAMILSGAFISSHVQAAITTDQHGNTAYDTAEECDMAVQTSSARFYQSTTTKPVLLRKGEASAQQTTLAGLGAQYSLGACDLGVGRSFNRDGVSKALQGKYVPYSPNMPVNVYFNKEGQPVRATMQSCDNNFSGPAPRAVPAPPAPATPPVMVAPMVAAPVVNKLGFIPYAFGTVGAARDGLSVANNTNTAVANVSDTVLAGQLGVGVQFNKVLGAEAFYQGSDKFNYNIFGTDVALRDRIFGARATVGGNLTDSFRMFAKLGVTNIRHKVNGVFSRNTTRPAAGLGMTLDLTENLALRADYDHTFAKKEINSVKWKDADYLGLGLQYNWNNFDK